MNGKIPTKKTFDRKKNVEVGAHRKHARERNEVLLFPAKEDMTLIHVVPEVLVEPQEGEQIGFVAKPDQTIGGVRSGNSCVFPTVVFSNGFGKL